MDVRGHRLQAVRPLDAGGTDTAPTPVALSAASTAICVAFYAAAVCSATDCHAPDCGSVRFTTAADRPARLGSVRVVLVPPPELSARRRAALLAVAAHCTVHHTPHDPPVTGIGPEA
ncbi:OsmC family peroxiredoxin [Streptomyces sp. NPDC000345]|uniref:OsmC family peroxiredoxin n=1 Tax=Streptomyces sp. NPDC000345 TaxID=3364537 RepID=UPI0036AFE220